MAEQSDTAPEQQAQEGNLTIADLQTISNIIDIAMTRGAFRANEAKTVGESYEKINAFLQTVQQTDHITVIEMECLDSIETHSESIV